MSRLVSWFSTTKGIIFTRTCVGLASFTVFANHIAVNGPLLDNLKSVFHLYKDGEPKPLSEKANTLIKQVLQECTLKEEEKEKLKFFNCVGHDVFHAGGTNSPWGAIVGIPFTFEDEIPFTDMRIPGRDYIDWIIDGQDLIQALRISDSARKFALMREIYSCDVSHVIQNSVIGATCVLIPARLAQMLNAKLNTLQKFNFRKRCMMYATLYFLGFLLYRCLKDPLVHLSNQKADELSAQTSPEYIVGGIEYYKKTLLRNKAIRELSDGRGKKAFDEHGNENYFLLAPKLPISKRLENLRKLKSQNLIKTQKNMSEKISS